MERSINLREFIHALRDSSADVPPARLLANAPDAWAALTTDDRAAILAHFDMADVDADALTIAIRKVSDGPSTVDNVRVILSWPGDDAATDGHDSGDQRADGEEVPAQEGLPSTAHGELEGPPVAEALADDSGEPAPDLSPDMSPGMPLDEAPDMSPGMPRDDAPDMAPASDEGHAPIDTDHFAFDETTTAEVLPNEASEDGAQPATFEHFEALAEDASAEAMMAEGLPETDDAVEMDVSAPSDSEPFAESALVHASPDEPVFVTAEEVPGTELAGHGVLSPPGAHDHAPGYAGPDSNASAPEPFDDLDAMTEERQGPTALAIVDDEPTLDADAGPLAEEPEPVDPETGSAAAEAGAPADADTDAEVGGELPPGEGDPFEEPKKGLFGKLFKKKAADASDSDGPITVIPPLEAPLREIEVYPIQDPYAFVRIAYDDKAHEYVYEVLEPQMDEREQNILEFVEETLVDVIEVGLAKLGMKAAAEMLTRSIDEIIFDYSIVLSPKSKEKVVYYILRNFLGFGKLDPMMRDSEIEDISCDGPNIPIFVYHRKYESFRSTIMFNDHDEADSFVIRLAQRSGKHISIAEPLLDATLPDGSRLNATLSDEVTANGSTFTIRKFKPDPFSPPDLVRFGTMNADILAYWWLAVQNGASAIYAGGTASGKTTSLNAILLFIPAQMKIVSIEDTREVNLPHPNWIPGVTRSGFGPRDSHGRQAGEIDMFTLLKAALRQRPEYILVGEVRGAEAYALFQAMATGHTAYGTMHADSAESVIHRLESSPISIPRSLLEALDIVSIQIQTRIGERRVRRTKELIEIVGLDPHTREILTNEVFSWHPATDEFEFSGVSYVLERIQMERNMSAHDMRLEFDDRKLVIDWLIKKEINDYLEVAHVIQRYYKEKDKLMEEVRRDMEDAPVADEPMAADDASDDEPFEFDATPPDHENVLERGDHDLLEAGDPDRLEPGDPDLLEAGNGDLLEAGNGDLLESGGFTALPSEVPSPEESLHRGDGDSPDAEGGADAADATDDRRDHGLVAPLNRKKNGSPDGENGEGERGA